MISGSRFRPHWPYVVALTGVLAGSFAVRLLLVPFVRWNNYDCGLHILLAQMLSAGHRPYSELFVSYPPLFLWTLQIPRYFSESLTGIELLIIGYAVLGVAATGFTAARLFRSRLAGIFAGALLSFSPQYLIDSPRVMTEVPAVAFGALSVAAVVAFADAPSNARKRLLLFGAGLLLCGSLMLKVLCPFLLALIPLMILQHRRENRDRSAGWIKEVGLDVTFWGLGLLALIVASLFMYDAAAMWQQVVVFRFTSRMAPDDAALSNPGLMMQFLRDNWPLAVAMLAGMALFARRWRRWSFVAIWLAMGILFALWHEPLRPKHLPMLLPPAAILAGAAYAAGWTRGIDLIRRRRWKRGVLWGGASLVLSVAMLLAVLNPIEALVQADVPDPMEYRNARAVVKLLKKYTAPDDCIVTDYPPVAIFSDRALPPALSELSYTRLMSEDITDEELIEITSQHGCQVIVPLDFRLLWHAPDYLQWVDREFAGSWPFLNTRRVFAAQPLGRISAGSSISAVFDSKLRLAGADLEFSNQDGRNVYVSLYWTALGPIEDDYSIQVRVVDAAGVTVAEGDHEPYGGRMSTRAFPVGKTIKETIRVGLEADVAAGEYAVTAALMSPGDTRCVPVSGHADGENRVTVGTVRIPE